MKDVILDAVMDSVKLIPFLFIAFLVIELFEHKFSDKSKEKLSKSKKIGPIIGSVFGIVPQCGFGVAATNLYATRIISLGTLFSVYFATSDEMIPILLAEKASGSLIIKILLFKLILGIIYGFIIDFVIRTKEKENYHICLDDHCHCDHENLFIAAFKHTFNIFIFIFVSTFIINLIMHYGGEGILHKLLLKDSIFAPFITCLIGLIPNCAASVILTELFVNNAISFASLIGGLLSGSGVGILVLFRTNKNNSENIFILFTLYIIGVITGIVLEFIL